MQDLFARKKHGVRLLMAASVIRRSATISASESSALIESQAWRVGRVAEGARLESVYTLIRIVGSNPTLSAKMQANTRPVARFSFLHTQKLIQSDDACY